MQKIRSKFNLISVVFSMVFFVILLFPSGVVYAGGDDEYDEGYSPENQEIQEIQKTTSAEEIMEKIYSMTNSVPREPSTPLSPTYTPGDDTGYGKESDSNTFEIEEASDPELNFGKNIKKYMSPYKVILIILAVDLLLLCGYFLYFSKKTESKIQ